MDGYTQIQMPLQEVAFNMGKVNFPTMGHTR